MLYLYKTLLLGRRAVHALYGPVLLGLSLQRNEEQFNIAKCVVNEVVFQQAQLKGFNV
jgi:hypothetical protein